MERGKNNKFSVKNYAKLGVFAGFLGAATVLAQAGHAQTISLKEGYQRMLSSEIELQSLGIEAKIAEEIVNQARGQRFPRVNLSIDYSRIRQAVLSSDNTTFQKADSVFPKTKAVLTIEQPLFDQARWRAMDLATARKALTQAQAEVTTADVTRQYVSAYLSVGVAQLQVQRARDILEARTLLERTLSTQIDSGRGDPIDLTRVQGDTFAAQSDLADAEQRRNEALFELYRFTGPDVESVRAVGGDLGAVNASNFNSIFSEEQVLAASPDVALARAQLLVTEKERDQANANLKPVVNLNLSATQEKTQGSLFGGGSDIVTGEAGIGLKWAVWEGGTRKSRLRETESRVELAKLRVAQAEDVVRRRLGALKESIQNAKQREAAIAAQAERAAKAFEEAKTQEEAGSVGVEVTLENQLRKTVLQIEQQSARLRTLQLEAELLGLLGALDTNSLSKRLEG